MKLKCRVVRLTLAGACKGEALPTWVEAHIQRCEECRKEASACRVMGTVLGTECNEGKCPVAWTDVRDRLGESPAPVRRRAWAPVAAAAACLVVVGVAVAVVLSPGKGPVREPVRIAEKAPVEQIPRAARNDESGAARNGGMDRNDSERVKQAPKRAKPRHIRIRRPAAKHSDSSRPNPRLMAIDKTSPPKNATEDERPKVIAIVPEEHVIEVVGVTVDRPDNSDYVIRRVSCNEDPRAVKL